MRFATLFLKVLNIDFPLILISLNVVKRVLLLRSLNDFGNHWCERGNVEPGALKEWKINIFKINDTCISIYSCNTHILPPKPKSSFQHLKQGIQDFHINNILVLADKAANNVVVV